MKDGTTVHYSRWVGSIFLFNLIVGTGALAMPKAFQEAGWLLSGIILTVLCFLSYITTTFVIESMSITNCLTKLSRRKYATNSGASISTMSDSVEVTEVEATAEVGIEVLKRNYGTTEDNTTKVGPSLQIILPIEDCKSSYFEITETFEMGEMAIKYFNKFGKVLFYLSMCIYLYGDLAVYAAAVPTSLRDIACTYQLNGTKSGDNRSLTDSDRCWPESTITRMNAYRIFLTGFILLLCPFVFFNVSKTKALQVATLSMRWLAFGIMFVLMGIYIGNGNKYGNPESFDFTKSPNLFGICIYAFMCHHSLPSLITPISKKRHLYLMVFVNFVLILGFYLVLSLLSSFTFVNIKSLITMNFEPAIDFRQPPVTSVAFLQYYLMLFPVFSLSTSFPIIGITLRNNLKNLVISFTGRAQHNWFMDKMLYPLLAIIPPILIVYSTDNIQFMVGFTGSYAGSVIQYLVPISLVLCARKQLKAALATWDDEAKNLYAISSDQLKPLYQSPFKHLAWAILIILWTVISIVFVTVNHVLK